MENFKTEILFAGYGGANGGSTSQKATKGVGAVSPSGGTKALSKKSAQFLCDPLVCS